MIRRLILQCLTVGLKKGLKVKNGADWGYQKQDKRMPMHAIVSLLKNVHAYVEIIK